MDPDPDGPKTCGSGSATLLYTWPCNHLFYLGHFPLIKENEIHLHFRLLVHVKIQDLEGGLIQEQQAQSLWIRQKQLTAVCRRAEPVATGPSVWMPGSIKTVLYVPILFFAILTFIFVTAYLLERALQYYKMDVSVFNLIAVDDWALNLGLNHAADRRANNLATPHPDC